MPNIPETGTASALGSENGEDVKKSDGGKRLLYSAVFIEKTS